MEKIQEAIAKARAIRTGATASEEPTTATTPKPPSRTMPPPPDPDARRDLWTALPDFVPDPQWLARNHIVAADAGHAAMGFDIMRTRLIQQLKAHDWRRVAITSPDPGCGKSTVALNLGLSLARQSELHTLVAEVDLRRPSLVNMLGLPVRHSFGMVLANQARLADNAVRIGTNLVIATNHSPSGRSAELLHSSTVGPALDAIEAEYAPDIMIFDMPPMLASDDVMAFMRHVDCVLLVAAAGSSRIAEIDTCERELAGQTNVMGVVLNKCRYDGPGYGYDYPDPPD